MFLPVFSPPALPFTISFILDLLSSRFLPFPFSSHFHVLLQLLKGFHKAEVLLTTTVLFSERKNLKCRGL